MSDKELSEKGRISADDDFSARGEKEGRAQVSGSMLRTQPEEFSSIMRLKIRKQSESRGQTKPFDQKNI